LKREVDLIVTRCGQLLTLESLSHGPRRGKDLAEIGLVRDGALAVSRGRIVAAGRRDSVMSAVEPAGACADIEIGRAHV
jgi:imidazolonepropionase